MPTKPPDWGLRTFSSREEREKVIAQLREMKGWGLRQVDVARKLGLHAHFVSYHWSPEKAAADNRAKLARNRMLRQERRVTLECEVCGDPHTISLEAHKKRLKKGIRQRCRFCSHPARAAAAAQIMVPAADKMTHEELRQWASGVLASWTPHERTLFASAFVSDPDDSKTEAAQHRNLEGARSLRDELERWSLPWGKGMRRSEQ